MTRSKLARLRTKAAVLARGLAGDTHPVHVALFHRLRTILGIFAGLFEDVPDDHPLLHIPAFAGSDPPTSHQFRDFVRAEQAALHRHDGLGSWPLHQNILRGIVSRP